MVLRSRKNLRRRCYSAAVVQERCQVQIWSWWKRLQFRARKLALGERLLRSIRIPGDHLAGGSGDLGQTDTVFVCSNRCPATRSSASPGNRSCWSSTWNRLVMLSCRRSHCYTSSARRPSQVR